MIRDYEPRDWQEVCRVYDAAKPVELETAGIGASFSPLMEDENRVAKFKEARVLVWEDADGLRGFVGYRREFIGWLFVDPQAFRRGIARGLLRVAVNAIGQDAWLWVLDQNTPAINLYRQEGFVAVEERPTSNGGMPCRMVRMERRFR